MSKNKKWGKARCGLCFGYGVVSDIRSDGDFYGAKDCKRCNGMGFIWISPSGRVADYPGGPFRGYATDAQIRDAFHTAERIGKALGLPVEVE